MIITINSIIDEFFETHSIENIQEESAMNLLKEAIGKIISDGYVRKELYKDKLAELSEMSETLSTALEALSTAETEIEEYKENLLDTQSKLNELISTQEEDVLNAKKESFVKAKLLEDGVNPKFLSLLIREIELRDIEFVKVDDTESIINWDEIVNQLRNLYPEAFENTEERVTRVSVPPVKGTTYPNPWNKDSMSLEAQIRLYRENPTLAKQLAASAGIKLF